MRGRPQSNHSKRFAGVERHILRCKHLGVCPVIDLGSRHHGRGAGRNLRPVRIAPRHAKRQIGATHQVHVALELQAVETQLTFIHRNIVQQSGVDILLRRAALDEAERLSTHFVAAVFPGGIRVVEEAIAPGDVTL